MNGTYNSWLVLLSLLVAVLASYTALDMAGRIAASEGRRSRWWLLGGSFAMGLGIWSMHFIGMLAFRLPVQMSYDPLITGTSLLMAIGSSAFALWLVGRERLTWAKLVFGALLMGTGVASMHYTGMAAMRMAPSVTYAPLLFSSSILIAIVASGAALWLVSRLREDTSRVKAFRGAASLLMGLAITGMHYTGMAAVRFDKHARCMAATSGVGEGWLAVLVIVGTVCVLGIALLTSTFDVRLESRTAKLADSLAYANQELTYLALHDPLTKLPNRAFLQRRIEQIIQTDKEHEVAALFIDLDGFKALNDAYGHDAGDDILTRVSERVQACLRSTDLVARLGGDEFVVLALDAQTIHLGRLAQRLIEAIEQPLEVCGHAARLSASIGIASSAGEVEDHRELLTYADLAMYQAKAQGGSGFRFFEPSMRAQALEQLELTQDLRAALERQELVLHYQPKFCAQSLELKGVEALLRWKHPARGMVAPDKFIPVAEKTGLIVGIGHWVLDEACRQMALWQKSGSSVLSVAVNLSALQLLDPSLVERVKSALHRHQLQSRQLVLEITETTAMRNVDVSMRILQQLDEIGVRISIDDFGTGYSSLLHLKRLPATELKIDRGFVRDLREGGEDRAIVSAIIALSKTLNLTVVAEGVETQEQQDFLTEAGCNALQGFLLGRPVPPEKLGSTRDELATPPDRLLGMLSPANI